MLMISNCLAVITITRDYLKKGKSTAVINGWLILVKQLPIEGSNKDGMVVESRLCEDLLKQKANCTTLLGIQ